MVFSGRDWQTLESGTRVRVGGEEAENRGCGDCKPGGGWCVQVRVRGQGSRVHVGKAGVVGLWVWEVGRGGLVVERGGVWEAGGRD